MPDLIPFDFDGHYPLRALDIDGHPWFIAGDVATILGFREASDLTRSLDDDEKGTHTVRTLGGNQSVSIISESGLYSGVLRSRVLQAKSFKRWITREVLPTIRRTGTYSTTPALTDAEIVHQALQITSRQVEALTAQVVELTPRAAVADHLLNASGDMSVGDAAKVLARSGAAIGQQRLFTSLDALGWTYRSGGVRHISQRAIEAGYLAALPKSHYHPKTGELVVDPPQVRVTPKGIARLLTHLLPAQEAS